MAKRKYDPENVRYCIRCFADITGKGAKHGLCETCRKTPLAPEQLERIRTELLERQARTSALRSAAGKLGAAANKAADKRRKETM